MAAVAHEACAFKIEKQVSLRRFRQPAEPLSSNHGESSHYWLTACALLQLNLSLIDDAVIGLRGAARRSELDRDRQGSRRGERCDALCDELLALGRADSGNEREVIIPSPLLVAALPPAADVAMLDRFRIAARQQRIRATRQCLEQPPSNTPNIGRVISDSILVNRKRSAWSDHKESIGHETLDFAKQISVERQLQDRAAARLAGEFGVVRLVMEISESRP